MGLLDLAGKVLVQYRADISDMKAKLKELTGAEKEMMQAQIKAAEESNRGLEEQKKGLEKLAVAIAVPTAAYLALRSGYREYREYTTKANAAQGVELEKLKEASGGLVSKMDLLTFAAKANHGAWKLNQEEMGDVLQAWRALVKEGNDAEQTMNDLSEALKSNEADALKKYGIAIGKTNSDLDKHKALLAALRGEYQKFGGDLSSESDGIERAGVTVSDALSQIKIRLGEIVVALAPLVDLLAKAVGLVADLIPGGVGASRAAKSMLDAQDQEENGWRYLTFGEGFDRGLVNAAKGQVAKVTAVQSELTNLMLKENNERVVFFQRDIDNKIRQYTAANKEAADRFKHDWAEFLRSRPVKGDQPFVLRDDGSDLGIAAPGGSEAFAGLDAGYGVENTYYQAQSQRQRELNARLAEERTRESRYATFTAGKAQSWSEKTFGPIEQFDAYAEGFGVLKNAAMESFQAWEAGSESLGSAIKKALANSLAATAQSMFAHGLEESAYALASLAFGDARGAAQHGIAAGAFFAGAGIVGGIASEMGAGKGNKSGGGAGASAAPSVLPGGGSGGEDRGRNVTVVLGDEFAEDSPFRRAQRVSRAIWQAKRSGGDQDGVTWG